MSSPLLRLETRARRRWALVGAPMGIALLVLAGFSSLPSGKLLVYAAPGALMIFIFGTTDAWLDDEGVHHKSTDSFGMTRYVPMADIAGADVLADTLSLTLASGKKVAVVPVRGRFVGPEALSQWVSTINNLVDKR